MNTSENITDCFPIFSTPNYINVIIVRGVASAVSMAMCAGALLLIAILKRWTVFSQKLIIYLLTSALLSSAAHLINIDFNHGSSKTLDSFCVFSALVWQLTNWMLQNAIFAVTIYLFFLIVFDFNTDKYKWAYILGIFFSPFLINWIPLLYASYGRSGAWCWIRSRDEESCEDFPFGQYLQFFLYYAPAYLLLIVGIILYIIILVNISRKQKKLAWINGPEVRARYKKMKSELLSLWAYPVVFAILNIPPFVNRGAFQINQDEPILSLWYLAAIFGPLYGGVVAIVFSVGTKAWQNISRARLWALFQKDTIDEYPLANSAMSDSYVGSSSVYVKHEDQEENS